jgi:ribonuclease HII
LLNNRHTDFILEAGCDEAGRGCLAGPVFAAATIMPIDFEHLLLNDSKKMTEKNRYFLRDIIEQNAIAWSVAWIDNEEIDKINILNASIKAMHLALDKLNVKPEFIIVDGNKFKKYEDIPHKTIIKGDGLYTSIAAASVLAKTYRDDYMQVIDNEFKEYGWAKNKAYATKFHREMIMKIGLTKYHRKTFCKFYFNDKNLLF